MRKSKKRKPISETQYYRMLGYIVQYEKARTEAEMESMTWEEIKCSSSLMTLSVGMLRLKADKDVWEKLVRHDIERLKKECQVPND